MKIAKEITVARPITTMLILKPPYEVAIKLGHKQVRLAESVGAWHGRWRWRQPSSWERSREIATRSHGRNAMKQSPVLKHVI
jgi:hypothetical protein